MLDRNLDALLRLASILTVCAGLLTLWTIAPLFAPRANSSEALLIEKCLGLHGFPQLGSWTGQMTGCER